MEIFAAIFELALGLLIFVMQRVTDFFVEIIGLVEYATSAPYRAEIDKQYEGQNRWLKWWALSANSIGFAFVVGAIATLFLLRSSSAGDEARKDRRPVREIEQLLLDRHKAHPQD